MAVQTPEDNMVDLVTKEIELTKLLASNDPKTRSEGIKQIKIFLLAHSGDTAEAFQLKDYMILWRGLFYFMWMSDKPLPQENAAEKISNLIHCCKSHQGKAWYLEAFFQTMKDDWMSISHLRIDKFMMLVRRCLRQVFFTFVNCDWDLAYMKLFNEILYGALKSFTLSLRNHIQEIFLEELSKASKGKVPSEALVIILDAFLRFISELNDSVLIKEVVQNVFRNLLSQSQDLEILQAKFDAWKKMGKPGSYNDLELVEGDISDNDDTNEQNNGPLDPRAGNVSVEIPRIKFNPKDVSKLLNKYVTEVDCSRKCLIELTKLIKWYNRLGEGVLPYKPKDLKLNSQILKRKKKKHLSKMIKEGVKRLEMVDSKIKKSSREVNDLKSLKELEKMGEIVIEHGKIGKSMWKVRKFEVNNALKENISINESWTVTDEPKNKDVSKETACSEDEPPLLVPAGFVVEDLSAKSLVKNSSPCLRSLTSNVSPKEDSSIKRKSPKSSIADESITKSSKKSISPYGKNNKSPNISNASSNKKSFLDHGKELSDGKKKSVSSLTTPDSNKKETKEERKSPKSSENSNISFINVLESKDPYVSLVMCKNIRRDSGSNCKELSDVKRQSVSSTATPDSITKNIKRAKKSDTLCKQNVTPVKVQSPKSSENSNNSFTHVLESKSPCDDLVMNKIKRRSSGFAEINTSLNESWSVCDSTKHSLSKQKSPQSAILNEPTIKNNTPKSKSPIAKNSSPNISHAGFSVSGENIDLSSEDVKSQFIKTEKRTSLSSKITPEKNSKSPKSPKSPTPEQRVLRRRTILISKKKLEGQKDDTPKRKSNNLSVARPLQKRRKTVAGEEITMSMLKADEISNKALEKIRSEAFEDGLNTPRKSSRLSFKTDSAKKRVEFQLRNNIEQEFMEYRTSLKKKKENPHDASKQPVQGVLKSTPDTIRINPFYKFKETSVKKNSRKSMI